MKTIKEISKQLPWIEDSTEARNAIEEKRLLEPIKIKRTYVKKAKEDLRIKPRVTTNRDKGLYHTIIDSALIGIRAEVPEYIKNSKGFTL